MPSEPNWVPLEALIQINEIEVAATGEPHRILSPALLESAWAKPINRWSYQGEEDIISLSVALMSGIAQNHPFQQGNKRTAFHAGLLMLKANSWTLSSGVDSASFADDFVRLVEHVIDEAAFVDLMRPHVVAYD